MVLTLLLTASSFAYGAGFPDPGQASADEINHLAITCGHDIASAPVSNGFVTPIRRVYSSRNGDRYLARYTFGSTEFEVEIDANHLDSIQYEVVSEKEKSRKTGHLSRLRDIFRFQLGTHPLLCGLWPESVLRVEEDNINLIVHPHFGYDPDSLIINRLTKPRSSPAQTVVLLESLTTIRALQQMSDPYYSDREILDGVGQPSLSEIELPKFPSGTQYFVAPSGVLPFQWNQKSPSTIWLSGGYFNACGLNAIKSLLKAFAHSVNSKVTLNVDMSASTLQGNSAGSEMVPKALQGKRMLLGDYPASYPNEFRKFLAQYEAALMRELKTEVKADFKIFGGDASVLDRIQIRIFDENDHPLKTYVRRPNTKTFDVHFMKYR